MTQIPKPKTERQKNVLSLLKTNFGLSDAELDRVLFINERDPNDPWIPPDMLEAIARQDGRFKQISVLHDKYIPQLEQVLYISTLEDQQGRVYTRSGVATFGERPNGQEIDTNTLASGRALTAVLTAAGYNPFKAGSVVNIDIDTHTGPLSDDQKQLHGVEDQAFLRNKDLRQIHKIAEEKGLIKGDDMSKYRKALLEKFNVSSAAVLGPGDRAAVVNWLNNYDDEYLRSVPEDLRADAMIA